ncbi:MAG: hypothetical protein IK012_11585 [Fibrobacter sp.]|uniref:hypothetical protein n=1 Tax=Fibrobacter sp. TaxID=35828 RepID=UPI0025BC44F5|nr:hypothetical protein [Fibrobacter sp.]MBR4785872.1 hypothetical protein [Fibrobacter sp.]
MLTEDRSRLQTEHSTSLEQNLRQLVLSHCKGPLNKPKPSTAETSLLVSIVEAPVYAMKSQYGPFPFTEKRKPAAGNNGKRFVTYKKGHQPFANLFLFL